MAWKLESQSPISMSANLADLKLAHLKHGISIKIKNLRVGIYLAFVLFIVFAIVDSFMYPQQAFVLITIRVVNNLLLALIFLTTYKVTFNYKSIGYANIFTVLLLSTSISAMILMTEGGASPYYAGLNLVLVGTSILFFFDLKETVIVSIGTIFLYIAACLIHYDNILSPIDYPWFVFINNLSFLLATAVICSFASYYLSKNRFETFRLNFELKQVNRLKNEFFFNTVHEIRSPLTLILSPIQALLEDANHCLSDHVAGHLKLARDNAMRLLKLVNNLLDIDRLESEKMRLHKAPQDLSTLLSVNVDSVIHIALSKQIVLNKHIPDVAVVVLGDEAALEKIFINLIINAVKFTPDGGQITASLKCVDDNAVIEISDTGIGISDVDLPHIFKRFTQVDSSSTRRYQGSGIGLALVNDLLEQQGGLIEAESELGKGTLMRITLPLMQESDKIVMANVVEEVDLIQQINRHSERFVDVVIDEEIDNEYAVSVNSHLPCLLIVDDEPDIRRYLKGLLEKKYQVIQARDGAQAIALVQQYHPDLMVLDMMLPEIDGLGVCKRLREGGNKELKILLLTARTDEQTKIETLKNGANDFLTKPFSVAEFETRLNLLNQTLVLERDLVQNNQQLSQALIDIKEAEVQLLHSEKLSAIGSLTSGLLHEVNNPLNYTITAAHILRRDADIVGNKDNKEMVDDIIEGMDRIKVIVADLHTFAYPEEVDKQSTFSLSNAIKSAIRFTAYECKDVDILVDIDDDLLVVGSNNHIVQVLINIITNAVKAIDLDKKKVIIKIGSEKFAADRVLVKIKDNGKGMDEQILSRIFEPFFTTRMVGEGLGMGLSICHTIIKNHNGELKAQSELGKWTEFSFDLAIAK